MPDNRRKEIFKEIPLTGRLITSEDATKIEDNFQSLKNMRYTDAGIKGGPGAMSKINTTQLGTDYRHMQNGFHFKKEQPAESHVGVQATDTGDADPVIIENETAIPSAGDFTAGVVYTEDTAAGVARFSDAPNGHMAMCDGKQACIWGGDEANISAALTSEATITTALTNPKDYSERVRNNLTDAEQRMIVGGGNDSNTVLLLHMDEATGGTNFDDSSASAHNPANVGNAQCSETQSKFGIASGYFDGTGDYVTVADHADFDFSADNTFTIDCWVRPETSASSHGIAGHDSGAADYFSCEVSATGDVYFKVAVGGSVQTINTTAGAVVVDDTWQHIAFVGDGTNYAIFVGGVLKKKAAVSENMQNYTGANFFVAHFDQPASADFKGWVDEFRVTKGVARWSTSSSEGTQVFTPPAKPYAVQAVDWIIGFTRPLQGCKFYVATGSENTDTSTLSMKEWNGNSWTSVTITDNTASGGISLAQTGTVTWSSTVNTSKPKYLEGYLLYWYNFTLTAGNAEIYYVTVDAPFQKIKDLWDGFYRNIGSYKIYSDPGSGTIEYQDYTVNVFTDEYDSNYDSTHTGAGLNSLVANTEWQVFGFSERMTGIYVKMVAGQDNQAAASTFTVSYWNGSAWSSVGTITDGTSDGTRPYAKTGVILWNPVSEELEHRVQLADEIPLYYYKVVSDVAFDATVRIYYASGIPAPQTIHSYKFPLNAKNRVMLCSRQDEHKNSVLVGSGETTDVYNGVDSTILYFGDEKELTSAISLYSRLGSNIYDITLFYKAHQMFGLTGYTPDDFQPYEISNTIGCVAPLTLKATIVEVPEGGTRPIVIWQGANGLYIFDNTSPVLISRDIRNFFNKNESNARKLHASYVANSIGFIDHDNLEYHWLFADGASTGTLNREWVFDLVRHRWFEIERSADLQCGFDVEDLNGNKYAYGCIDTGYMERLENGNTSDGSNITAEFQIGDIAPVDGSIMYLTQIIRHKLVTKDTSTTAEITVTHYADTKAAGSVLDIVDPTKSGYRVANVIENTTLPLTGAIFHSYKYSCVTGDQNPGFHPLYIGQKYNIIGEEKA
jgi:hypothetical protein